MKNPREVTLHVIYDILKKGVHANIILNEYLVAEDVKEIDKGLITELVYGTLRKLITIDYIISRYSKIKIKDISLWILNIIRIGIYQIVFCDRIPEYAICSESVKLARKYGHKGSINFVNGILRNIIRDKEKIVYPLEKDNLLEYLTIKYSFPNWLVEKWLTIFGYEFTINLLEVNNRASSEFSVRVNTNKLKLNDLQQILKNDNIITRKSEYTKDGLIIENKRAVNKIAGFDKGYFYVQSEASMMVADILDPKEKEYIIDLCSAPGGKTTHIAQKMKNKGKIIALDINRNRLKQVNENAERLGIEIIDCQENNGVIYNEKFLNQADRILVDAPCSGFGIINSKPDILLNRKSTDTKELSLIQGQMLDNASMYLKNGGVLVYSTCTIEPDENEYQVNSFLERNTQFVVDDLTPLLPASLKNSITKDGYLTLYPHIHSTDGFFIARLIKKG